MVAILGLGTTACVAESALAPTAPTAPIEEVRVGEWRKLGLWDDVFLLDGQGLLILRRDAGLFSLALGFESNPGPLAEFPEARDSRIVFAVEGGEETWLFFDSETHAPFALGLDSKTRLSFEIPGWQSPPNRPPVIQSWVVGPDAVSAVLMISGSDSNERWPRPGNRPIYFWVSLASNKVLRLPVGWDLAYFSADQFVAVFEEPEEQRFQRRPLAGLDMRTGEPAAVIPDRQEQAFVPFNWTYTGLAKPLFAPRREETGDRDSFVGVATLGRTVPLQVSVGEPYLPTVKASDSWVAFHFRGRDWPRREDHSLWYAKLEENAEAKLVNTEVYDFLLLGHGKCLFVQAGHGPKQASFEAFVYDDEKQLAWNVLEGLERLAPLDPEFADKSYVADEMRVQLVAGVGASKTASLALVMFSHHRGDMRSLVVPVGAPSLETQVWRASVLVSANGGRLVPDLFRDEAPPDLIYLHNSGELLVGEFVWSQDGERRVRLSAIELSL